MAVNDAFAQALIAAARARGLMQGNSLPPAPPPSASPAPDPSTLPWDAQGISQLGANALPYNRALAQAPEDFTRAGQDFGYSVNYTPGAAADPNDPSSLAALPDYTIGDVDTSNPYSRAALLQRSFENRQRGNTTSMAARGQLYSGSLQNAQNTAGRENEQAKFENRRAFEDYLRGQYRNLGGLKDQAQIGGVQAHGDLIGRHLNDPAPSTVTYAGVPYTPGTAENAFAAPVGAPTAESVMASQSLRGTAWDRPIIGPRYPVPKKPKRKP